MFQLPYLPELSMKCRDFHLLEEVFLSKPMVSNRTFLVFMYSIDIPT